MSREIDAYSELLGIAADEQPPNLYRLLGLSLFESDPAVITEAAERRMRDLRSVGISEFDADAQRLLNEVAIAKLYLADEQQKSAYDQQLRKEMERATRAAPTRPRRKSPATEAPGSKRKHRQTLPDGAGTPSAPAAPEEPPERIIEQEWVLGSGPDCDIILEAEVVSRQHCRLLKTNLGYYLEDLGSTNGTYVNRLRISEPVRVLPRDRITLGRKLPMPWPPEAVFK